MWKLAWRLALYISQDDKQTGLTYLKATYRLMGLFFWGPENWWQRIYSYVPIVTLAINSTLILMLALHNWDLHPKDGFVEFVKGTVLVFTFYFSMVKLIILQIRLKEFRKVIDFFESQPTDGGVDTTKGFKRILKTYAGVLTTTGVVWGLLSTIVRGTAYEIYWPFDPSPKILFKVLGSIQKIFCNFYCIYGHIVVDTTLSMMVCYLAYQGTRLEAFLTKIGKVKKEDLDLLQKAVNQHVIMIKSVNYIKSTYQSVFLAQVTYTIVHACVTTFSAMKVNDSEVIATKLIPMLCSAYIQLFVYCNAGEKIKTIMDQISHSIYQNMWYHSDLKVRKSLVIMLIVATRTVTMNSYGISTASLATYLQSVQESFSYYLALKTISSNIE